MKSIHDWLQFVLGLIIVSVGIVFTIKADLGVSPWNVFHIGLTNYFNITVGWASQITGFVIIILSFLMARIKPTWGTVINIVLVGFVIDGIMLLLPDPASLIFRYIYLFLGLIVFGFGVGVYISAECGTGPRDSLMVALDKKLKVDISWIRTSIEIFILIIGYILGGPVGIGTVLSALAIGPIMGFSLKLMNLSSRKRGKINA
ncbi:hypothetical protein BX659_12448 [Orenia metallireducens]|jgi:hypothetical protein|uniref:Membrane protein YczE n=1 Tax=Orenia metallireducens TaxID=1413210 RepID=A0A285G9R2_9FIRM|nr:membrane protein [Orenia metallireducens]PRX24224.1 hypothetical protein BX659_12448 [Orenia metallireducens]SNY19864.1 hypothetical protein SAMN06265827_105199 [Orenia metallireducens]